MKPLSPCGTPAAYKRHRLNGEEACDPCKAAHNARERARKAARQARAAEAAQARKAEARARYAALARLATRHAAEYKALYNRELARLGAAA